MRMVDEDGCMRRMKSAVYRRGAMVYRGKREVFLTSVTKNKDPKTLH